jgi:hypothetical protein
VEQGFKAFLLVCYLLAWTPSHVAAHENAVEDGHNVCITDRAVGFQPSENGTGRYAGAIQVSPERQKFFLEIKAIKQTPYGDTFVHNLEYCSSPKRFEELVKAWDARSSFLSEVFINMCLVKTIAVINNSSKYYSLGENFFESVPGGDTFYFWNGWNFSWHESLGSEYSYLMEGRCDLQK